MAQVAGQQPARFGDEFWEHWGDGQAEVSGYALTFPRYRQSRTGTAVAIFVTESFDRATRVKTEPRGQKEGTVFPVMKLNLVQDFPTGIYDYNLMTSVFVALTPVGALPAGSVTKASLSAQEWCGHAYQQILFDDKQIRHQLHSYFEGEADQDQRLPHEKRGLPEDALLLWARGLAGPTLARGQEIAVPLLRSMQSCRLSHVPLVWDQATLSRSADTHRLAVPAGDFEVETWSVQIDRNQQDPRPRMDWKKHTRWTIEVEHAPPRRIIRWHTDDGYEAQLLGTERLKYWRMNGNGQEAALKDIGLTPQAHPTR